MLKLFIRGFAFCFLCAFVAEVIVLATVTGERPLHQHARLSEATALNLLQVVMEGTEEVEEETVEAKLELDLSVIQVVRGYYSSNRMESSVRNFRCHMDLFSRLIPVYTAIHSFVI
ncbi:MAG: hypothetical protein ACKORJ_00220 [Bacteroidota bacterium]